MKFNDNFNQFQWKLNCVLDWLGNNKYTCEQHWDTHIKSSFAHTIYILDNLTFSIYIQLGKIRLEVDTTNDIVSLWIFVL